MITNWRDEWTTPSSGHFEYRKLSDQQDRDLHAAFEALGLDRVVAGARALSVDDKDYKGWDNCFLALAYGEVGELQHMVPLAVPDEVREARMQRRMRWFPKTVPGPQVFAGDLLDEVWTTSHSVGRLLGISIQQVDLVSGTFDSDRKGFTSQLTQWLQARNVNAAVVMRETRRETEAQQRLGTEHQAPGDTGAVDGDNRLGVHHWELIEEVNGLFGNLVVSLIEDEVAAP